MAAGDPVRHSPSARAFPIPDEDRDPSGVHRLGVNDGVGDLLVWVRQKRRVIQQVAHGGARLVAVLPDEIDLVVNGAMKRPKRVPPVPSAHDGTATSKAATCATMFSMSTLRR